MSRLVIFYMQIISRFSGWGGSVAKSRMLVALNSPSAPQAGPTLTQMVISIGAVTASTITVIYQSLPGNQPSVYNNFVAIWQSTMIPWGQPPLRVQQVSGGGQSGSLVLYDLSVQAKPYIIGYGVGPEITSIAASDVIYVGGQAAPCDAVVIGLAAPPEPDSLVVHYQTLPGYLPLTAKNWIGIWQGQASPYYSGPPLYTAKPDQDVSEGYIAMNGLSLTIGTTYTLVYFTGAAQTEAAAILTFTTAGMISTDPSPADPNQPV